MDNDFQREDQRASSLEIPLAWTVASPQWRTRVHQPRKVVQAPPKWKVAKKYCQWRQLGTQMQILAKNNELEQNHPFGARSSTFLLICISTINMIHTKKPCVFSQYVKNMWWRRHWLSQTVQRSCGHSDHVFGSYYRENIANFMGNVSTNTQQYYQ